MYTSSSSSCPPPVCFPTLCLCKEQQSLHHHQREPDDSESPKHFPAWLLHPLHQWQLVSWYLVCFLTQTRLRLGRQSQPPRFRSRLHNTRAHLHRLPNPQQLPRRRRLANRQQTSRHRFPLLRLR